jgi:hypothetical protein
MTSHAHIHITTVSLRNAVPKTVCCHIARFSCQSALISRLNKPQYRSRSIEFPLSSTVIISHIFLHPLALTLTLALTLALALTLTRVERPAPA